METKQSPENTVQPREHKQTKVEGEKFETESSEGLVAPQVDKDVLLAVKDLEELHRELENVKKALQCEIEQAHVRLDEERKKREDAEKKLARLLEDQVEYFRLRDKYDDMGHSLRLLQEENKRLTDVVEINRRQMDQLKHQRQQILAENKQLTTKMEERLKEFENKMRSAISGNISESSETDLQEENRRLRELNARLRERVEELEKRVQGEQGTIKPEGSEASSCLLS